MAEIIPPHVLDLFEKPLLAHFATIMPDGSPQITPVWVDFDGTYVRINTAKERQKTLNVQKRPQVALDIVDAQNPFHWVTIRGYIAEITEEGAKDHINVLSHKYTGANYRGFKSNETRVIFKIVPEHVRAS